MGDRATTARQCPGKDRHQRSTKPFRPRLSVPLGRPRKNAFGLRHHPSHPVADKGIEHFPESGENGFELFLNVQLPTRGNEGDRGHRGLLAKLTAMIADDAVGMRDGLASSFIGEI